MTKATRSGLSMIFLGLAACSDDPNDSPDAAVDAPVVDTPGAVDAPDAAVDAPDAAIDAPSLPATCADPLPCPAPSESRFTICGRLHDVETTLAIESPGPVTACLPGAPTASGPCALRLVFHDALVYAMNPATAPPLAPASLTVDTCGRYAAHDLPRPSFGFVGIVTDDAVPAADAYVPTATVRAADVNQATSGVDVHALRVTTGAAWWASSGRSSPYHVNGAALFTFRFHGVPQSGVIVRRDGQPISADDSYFSDGTIARTTVMPLQPATGTNGSVLVVQTTSPVQHDGTGGLPSHCRWPTVLSTSVPGTLLVHVLDAIDANGAPCP